MKQLVLSIIVLALLCTACGSEVEDTIEGSWSIDTVHYNGFDIITCLDINVINFEDERGASRFPSVDRCSDLQIHNETSNGNWEIINSTSANDSIPLRLIISAGGNIFEGTHNVVFHADQSEKLLKMEIWSDSLYVLLTKGLYNYDKNLPNIKRLEALSWKGKK